MGVCHFFLGFRCVVQAIVVFTIAAFGGGLHQVELREAARCAALRQALHGNPRVIQRRHAGFPIRLCCDR